MVLGKIDTNKESVDLPRSLFLFTKFCSDYFGHDKVDINLEADSKLRIPYEEETGFEEELFNTFFSTPRKSLSLTVVIKFPEFYIVNSQNHRMRHKIRDFYFKVEFNINYAETFTHVNGARGTYTINEFSKLYKHSHVSSNEQVESFSYFCIGDGPIKKILKWFAQNFIISNINKRIIDREELLLKSHLFCTTIKDLIQIESVEGGPYLSIHTLKLENVTVESNGTFNLPSYAESEVERAMSSFDSASDEPIEFTDEIVKLFIDNMQIIPSKESNNEIPVIIFNRPKILYGLHLIGFFVRSYSRTSTQLSTSNPNTILNVRSNDILPVNDNILKRADNINNSSRYYITFKGKQEPIKIIGMELFNKIDSAKKDFYVNPLLYNGMVNKITSIIVSKYIIRNK